jgi:hypothetical protein
LIDPISDAVLNLSGKELSSLEGAQYINARDRNEITKLDLSNNQLRSLPVNMFELFPNLGSLDVSRNYLPQGLIETISGWFANGNPRFAVTFNPQNAVVDQTQTGIGGRLTIEAPSYEESQRIEGLPLYEELPMPSVGSAASSSDISHGTSSTGTSSSAASSAAASSSDASSASAVAPGLSAAPSVRSEVSGPRVPSAADGSAAASAPSSSSAPSLR